MLKPTRYRNKFYSRGKGYDVSEETAKRWIAKRIAIVRRDENTSEPVVKADHGITVLPEEETPKEESQNVEDIEGAPENNGNPTIKELREIAKVLGIKGYTRLNKQELMEKINGNNNG